MNTSFVRDIAEGQACVLSVRIHPGARRNGIVSIHGAALKISLTTPAVEGRANEALISFLAETLGLPKARIALMTGVANRFKLLKITGKSAAEVEAALFPAILC